ncbi:MAG TPA: hypothetical protein PKD17_06740 [Cellvibrionaceae bacterium]|nr:hypothetical protein [Cellvibrionaceae bacterium]HMW71498.1 hypothetical protein [Cellvibrionaceae bacterium]HMY38525.1 hypothetical protein [Marinagarivorans sp.]
MNPKITFITHGQKDDIGRITSISYGFYFDGKPILRDGLFVAVDDTPEDLAYMLKAFSGALEKATSAVREMDHCQSLEECLSVANDLLRTPKREGG